MKLRFFYFCLCNHAVWESYNKGEPSYCYNICACFWKNLWHPSFTATNPPESQLVSAVRLCIKCVLWIPPSVPFHQLAAVSPPCWLVIKSRERQRETEYRPWLWRARNQDSCWKSFLKEKKAYNEKIIKRKNISGKWVMSSRHFGYSSVYFTLYTFNLYPSQYYSSFRWKQEQWKQKE